MYFLKSLLLLQSCQLSSFLFFFFNDTAPPEISPLSLPDALPISLFAASPTPAPCISAQPAENTPGAPSSASTSSPESSASVGMDALEGAPGGFSARWAEDRKSNRLNSRHPANSDAVFCFKKKTDN